MASTRTVGLHFRPGVGFFNNGINATLILLVALALAGVAMMPCVASATTGVDDVVPEGLSRADWAELRELLEMERYRPEWVAEPPVDGADGAWHAPNHQQQMHAYFSGGAVYLVPFDEMKPWRMALRFTAWGWDGTVVPVAEVGPETRGDRIEYRRGDLTEWYINDRRGIEQGFTIGMSPGALQPSTLHLQMEVSGSLQPSLTPTGDGVQFEDARAKAVVRYAGLRAWDARGRDLNASLTLQDDLIEVRVDVAGAAFPLTVDPLLTQVALLLPTHDPFAQDQGYYGFAVDIDGDTAVIGAPGQNISTNTLESGAAYIYVHSGSAWDLQAVLNGSSGGRFGTSVAVDGDWLVIGAPEDDTDSGTAAVYSRVDSTWSLADTLTADDRETGDEFGISVGLDGTTAVVGARYDDHAGGSNAGSAYVFVYSGTDWVQQVKLVAFDGAADDQFGCSVAVSGDRVVVGAIADDTTVTNTGSAYVFVRSGASWRQDAKLGADDAAFSDFFGGSVSIDGDTVVVGAKSDDHAGGTNAGSAYVFVRSGTTWTQQTKLVAGDAAYSDYFGNSVSFHGDTAVVGASSEGLAGSAYVFVRSGSDWIEQEKLVGSGLESGDQMGTSVAVSGEWVFVGAPRDDYNGGIDAGSAWAFVRTGSSWSEEQNLISIDTATDDEFGNSVAISGDTVVVGAPGDRKLGVSFGSVGIFVRTGDSWALQAKLMNDSLGPFFGCSVAIDGETVAVGSKGDNTGGPGAGSVFLFMRSGTSWSGSTKLVAGDAVAGDHFGWSVAIDGDTVVVGAPDTVNSRGSAYIFVDTGWRWEEEAKLTAGDGVARDYFGWSVAVDGDTAVVGAPGAGNKGSAYVFQRSGTSWAEQAKLVAGDGAIGDQLGYSVGIDADTIVAGAPWSDFGGELDVGSAYVFQRVGTSWSEQQKLFAASPVNQGAFGTSVSLEGDSIAVGMPDGNGSSGGAAFVYLRSGATWSLQSTVGPGDPEPDDDFGTSVAIQEGWLVVGSPGDNTGEIEGMGSASIFRPAQADVQITKDDGQAVAIPGQSLTYTVIASNPVGPDSILATVSDVFPAGLSGCSWTCVSTGGATCTAGGVGDIADSVDLPVGGVVTYTATCMVDQSATGTVTNTATVEAPMVEDSNPANNTATDVDSVTPQADLSVTKSNFRGEIVETFRYPYTIVASNPGPSDAPNTVITDVFPSELTDCIWTCTTTGGATCGVAGAGVLNDAANLPAGTSATYTATCTVAVSSGLCSNAATITPQTGLTDPAPGNNTATDVDHVTALADWIFGDGFESGNTNAWSGVVPPLKLRPMLLDQLVERIRATFRLTGAGLSSRASGPIFAGLDKGGKPLFVLLMRHRGEQVLFAMSLLRADGSRFVTQWNEAVSDDGQFEVVWRRSLPGLSDGRLVILEDGLPLINLEGLENQSTQLDGIGVGEDRQHRPAVADLILE